MFKIGEFARIADVSAHLLRHYDDIGLFQPIKTDAQTGYRYYSMEQLPRLHRIMALRDLGLTLDQITRLLDGDLADCEIRGMLTLKRSQVEQTIAEEHARLKRIESRLHQLEHPDAFHEYAVVSKEVAPISYLSTGWQQFTDSQSVHIVREARQRLKLDNSFLLVLVHDQPTDDGRHNIEVGFPVDHTYPNGVTLSGGYQMQVRPLAGVSHMATAIHHGPRVTIGNAYQAIFTWMEHNGYHFQPEASARERYLAAALKDTETENIIEIQIPLETPD